MTDSLKVLFVASEVSPFAKTGGLADVAGSLPGVLKKLGVDVRVGVPFYQMARDGDFNAHKVFEGLEVPVGDVLIRGDVFETSTDEGVPVYLFDQDDLFGLPGLYGTPEGDYPDNLKRFTFFCSAALLFAKKTGFRFNVVHCNDWQTGLIPVYLKTLYRTDPFFSDVSSVFTIHNIAYQGLFPKDELSTSGIPLNEFHPEGIEYWDQISLLKAGIVYADAITTVSPRYSQEIQTPELGMGMDDLLKKRSDDFYGILNGVDYSAWDPARDTYIADNYFPGKMDGKQGCKESLIQEMGMDPSLRDRPLLGMVSRLDAQKGLDILVQILDKLLALDVGLVILGSGDALAQASIRKAAERHPGRLGLKIGFDESLAHRIMAGSDIILVPSRYEPCGLTQIYGLKYGTVPIVRATGGLDDTIEEFDLNSGTGTGFKFVEYEARSFLEKIKEAVDLFKDRAGWMKLVENGMQADFSWEKSALEYISLYKKMRGE